MGSETHRSQPRPRPRSWLRRLLGIALVSYLGIVVPMVIFERFLVFFPARYPQGNWGLQPPGVEDLFFQAADGTSLHAWYAPHQDPLAVVLFAHGNAGNLTHRVDVLQRLHQQLRCTVLLFDYRGYGKSEGTPSESGLLQDARAAREVLAQRAGVDVAELVLMGRSLGTAVAVDLAVSGGARAVVLHSGFPSLPEVAAQHYGWLPVRSLMRNRFDSITKIKHYHGPLLQTHGTQDEIIPIELGQRLFAAAPTEQKQWLAFPGHGHNDPLPEEFYRALEDFLTR